MMSALSQLTAGGPRAWAERLAWLMFAALMAMFAIYWAKFAYNAYLTAIFPGSIDYGEGIVWQQALLIPGPRMYGDVQVYPFLVFHYPPVYHLIVHALASLGVPWLIGGRLVSTLSTVALAALSAAFIYESSRSGSQLIVSQRASLAGALVTGLIFVTLQPIQFFADDMRVDMLAMAFDFLGMYLALCSLRRPSLVYPAALAFVFALYTKQTMLEGTVATFVVMLLHAPARALRAAIFAAFVGGLAFALLTIATEGGFPRHVILYNVNRFSLRAAFDMFLATRIIMIHPIYLLLSFVAAAALIMRLLKRPLREAPPGHLMILLYFILSTANLVALGKSGAGSNYLVPWVSSWVLLIGLSVVYVCQKAEQQRRPLPLLALLAALILQAVATPKFGDRRVVDPGYRREYAELLDMTRHATKPVLSDDMVLLMQTGKEVPWEPSIISELSAKGLFDERKVVSMIETHALAFAAVTGSKGDYWFDARYSPAVAAALAKAYPVERQLAGMRVLTPAQGD